MGERRAEEGDRCKPGTLDLHKREPDAATGDRWRPDTPSSREREAAREPYTARPLSLSRREKAAGREAARRGRPRTALRSTLTLILVASLFVT